MRQCAIFRGCRKIIAAATATMPLVCMLGLLPNRCAYRVRLRLVSSYSVDAEDALVIYSAEYYSELYNTLQKTKCCALLVIWQFIFKYSGIANIRNCRMLLICDSTHRLRWRDGYRYYACGWLHLHQGYFPVARKISGIFGLVSLHLSAS